MRCCAGLMVVGSGNALGEVVDAALPEDPHRLT